ncbi:hypothetical protein JKP88DRAFT_246573 [Tribonema minus]|uniref:Glycoside hydrolase family 5 domain-containing protein n=1 Tax=Tribonema minus TaxID=303371 RepID=A0A835YVG5_9STRA|nr:hypothetical protein JKP88DRAFT_246573 [Tribonema minus]
MGLSKRCLLRWRTAAAAAIVVLLQGVPAAVSQQHEQRAAGDRSTHCFPTSKVTWINGNEGRVFMRDEKGGLHHLRIKGVSWHGFDTNAYSLNGLDETIMEEVLTQLQRHRFNAIRVPISLDFALWRSIRVAERSDVCGEAEMASMQLHRLFLRAAAHGMLVMLDLHALHARGSSRTADGAFLRDEQYAYGLPDLLRAWDGILFDYLVHPNFFALDAFDGPHFSPDWKDGSLNFAAMMQQLAVLLGRGHEAGGVTRWFKGLLGMKPHRERSLKVADHLGSEQWQRRVVYTPQIVTARRTPFSHEEILRGEPSKLFAQAYGYLELQHGHAVIVANWLAGSSEDPDNDKRIAGFKMEPEAEAQYVNLMAEWLHASGLSDVFFDLDPTEVGLFRHDWKTLAKCRLGLLDRINPNPTLFGHINTDEICVADWGGGLGAGQEVRVDYNGLDCTDSLNNFRCITCDSPETTAEIAAAAMAADAPRETTCVPWSFYADLNQLDEQDKKLRQLSAKLTKAQAAGLSSEEVSALHRQVTESAQRLTEFRKTAQNFAVTSGDTVDSSAGVAGATATPPSAKQGL